MKKSYDYLIFNHDLWARAPYFLFFYSGPVGEEIMVGTGWRGFAFFSRILGVSFATGKGTRLLISEIFLKIFFEMHFK